MDKFWVILLGCSVFSLSACKGVEPSTPAIAINEVVSSNDGVSIDESGQTEDWLELVNTSAETLNLSNYAIADSAAEFHTLPPIDLAPNAVIVLWADDDPEDGPMHLPFKLSASGDSLQLKDLTTSEIIAELVIPPLPTNQSYARFPSGSGNFVSCRYPSPNKVNGNECRSNATPTVPDLEQFTPFSADQWPQISPTGVGINELALFPAEFVEFKNFADQAINLNSLRLVLAPYPPTSGLPDYDSAYGIELPSRVLDSGEVWSLTINSAMVQPIADQAFNEGIAVLYDKSTHLAVDRVPFMFWPNGKVLSRNPASPFQLRFCHNSSPNLNNTCDPLDSRPLGNRTRGIYTPNDFAVLAEGAAESNIESVKFIIDLDLNNAVHFTSSRAWPLHYTFVREIIDQDPALNRCNAVENQLFNDGWWEFSVDNYFNNLTRRYHLGTLSKHANANLNNIEFTFGDVITAEQMRDAFYWVTSMTQSPYTWSLRPQDADQVSRVRAIEGSLPLVGPNAPFANVVYQGLAHGVAYGTLTYIPTGELPNTTLGSRMIVITNDVPNDIDFVAGLITEAFQTPLAHVNILSQSRKTPNMALPNASTHPDFKPLLGKLVRLEVNDGGYSVRLADAAEAELFWSQQNNQSEPLIPRLDSQTTQLLDLANADINDIPTIGAKAAQLAELYRIDQRQTRCSEGANFELPEGAFAIPMSHYLKHMNASGAQTYLDSLLQDNLFLTDSGYRKLALNTLKQMIMEYAVDANLIMQVEALVAERFGNKKVRFRSSSNTEDLQEFNGAGLYESISAELDDDKATVERAIKTVWASLWNPRAFDERLYANVVQESVAMAILVHKAFTNERANGVAVARNILSPTRTDQYYFNSQAGEASVTNPAPGIVTEQLIYQWPPRTPTLTYHSYSNLVDGEVISSTEVRALACSMSAIQNHFQQRLDPSNENRWFSMESEFKFLGSSRTLLIKQARPYKLGKIDIPNDCREIE